MGRLPVGGHFCTRFLRFQGVEWSILSPPCSMRRWYIMSVVLLYYHTSDAARIETVLDVPHSRLERFPKCWDRHRERREAIQGPWGSALRPLDCFVAALLAMTGGHAKSGSALAIPRQTPHAPTPRGRRGRSRRASPRRRVACGKIGLARAQTSVRWNRPPTAIVRAQRRRRQRRTRRRVLDRLSRFAPAGVARGSGLDPKRRFRTPSLA